MKHTGQGSSYFRFLGQLMLRINHYFNSSNRSTNTPKNNKQSVNQKPINRTLFILKFLGYPLYLVLLTVVIFSTTLFTFFLTFLQYIGRSTYLSLQRLFSVKLRLPKLTLPRLQLPKVPIPTISFHAPHFSFPRLSLPRFHPRIPRLRPISLRPKLSTTQLVFVITLFTITSASLSFYYWILKDLPSPRKLVTLQPKLTTQIFDRHGKLLYKIYDDERRTLIPLESIPLYSIQATIAIEDKNFYQHQGFSVTGIARAIQRNLTSQDFQGGSTITQQLIKNTLLTNEKTFRRKIKEVILAVHTELIFNKDQILQMYFNQVGYGGPAYGIQEAAQQYLGKNASDLNLAESAFLAGLPQAPTRYSPFGAHPELAKLRQQQVLDRMLEDGYITEQQRVEALATPITFASPETSILAPHFVMYVKDLLVSQYGEDLVSHGGLQVHTSLDLGLQDLAQKNLNQELLKLTQLQVSNGATLVTEPSTGQILAMVGSRDYFDIAHDGQVNLTTSLRQPGSSIKPINYALALEKGYTPASVILDAPITFNLPGSEPYSPKNYDGKFHGNVTLRTALASSYNIPAIKLLSANGVIQMVQLAQQMGITSWNNPSRYGLSITLGSNEVKMTEMAEVYGTFANLGTHVSLNPILSINDSTGKNIPFDPCMASLQRPSSFTSTVQAASIDACQPRQVISAETAYLISNILSDNQARSPAFGTHSVLNIPNHQVAVKTGTSNDLRDNWTIGYTADYLVATWVGNNDSTPMSRVASGVTGASPIWSKTISSLLENTKQAVFPTPQNIVMIPVCTLTGTLTCTTCPSVKLESFALGTEPKTRCSAEQISTILEKSKTPLAQSPTGLLLPNAASTSR